MNTQRWLPEQQEIINQFFSLQPTLFSEFQFDHKNQQFTSKLTNDTNPNNFFSFWFTDNEFLSIHYHHDDINSFQGLINIRKPSSDFISNLVYNQINKSVNNLFCS